ncbi:hypothetical protein [Altibacter sp. HG106]|uniref:hypothetical protein n=1 Tax=Altibacter sp. HG106 TaxID=3023937 RepID=UPI00234FB855|nr:hypothetical protein [Altibacter sp. HG106]MDC7995783.1 hypothetical protein [Altibacter sp. HG106]
MTSSNFLRCCLFSLLLIGFQSKAQRIEIDKEKLQFLQTEDTINVVFTYQDLHVQLPEFTEADFLADKQQRMSTVHNSEEIEDWMTQYQDAKQQLWPNELLAILNERVKDYKNGPVFMRNAPKAAYTLTINTYWLYFGYNVVIKKEPAQASMTLNFHPTNYPLSTKYKTTLRRAMGLNDDAYNFEGWEEMRRMGEAYERAGYKLAKALKRVVD